MDKHGKPAPGMECACCYDDIESENYVEYRSDKGTEWLPSLFCEMCIMTLIKRQWPIYEESLAKATCKAQQKRMLGEGPPTHVHDKKALACPEGESVHSLWFMRDGQVHSAALEGAPQGEARKAWWDDKLAFQFDEDDEEEEGGDAEPVTETTPLPPPPPQAHAAPPSQEGNTPQDSPIVPPAPAGVGDGGEGMVVEAAVAGDVATAVP